MPANSTAKFSQNTIALLDKCRIDCKSRFFQKLLLLIEYSDPVESSSSSSEHTLGLPVSSPSHHQCGVILDLQHVIDCSGDSLASQCQRSSTARASPESSLQFQSLYTPSGKWEWISGRDVVEEASTFLSDGAMCSTFIKKGRVDDREGVTYICKSWQTHQDWDKAFYLELGLYKKQLASLQGKFVPQIITVLTSPGALNVAMEPPHTSFWIEASTDMPVSLKNRCVEAYTKIHSQGVLHGDVELRHMLIGGGAQVTIIDFQESAALEPNEALNIRHATDADLRKEMRKVKVKLDYPGARAYELRKRDRYQKPMQKRCKEAYMIQIAGDSSSVEMCEDDVVNPPVLDAEEWQGWIAAPGSPRLFIMPGQSDEQRAEAFDAFLASLQSLPQAPAYLLDPSYTKPGGGSPSASPIQQSNRPLSSIPHDTRKRRISADEQGHSNKHPRLIDDLPLSAAIDPSARPVNVRVPKTRDNGPTGARVAMRNLAHCALEELPHPDLMKLFPTHPRWNELDVQVFRRRLDLQRLNAEASARAGPDKMYALPRELRSRGSLKRALGEIQCELQSSPALILGKRVRDESGLGSDASDVERGTHVCPEGSDNTKRPRISDVNVCMPFPKVRFALPPDGCDESVLPASLSPSEPIMRATPWYRHYYQKSLSRMSQLLSWG